MFNPAMKALLSPILVFAAACGSEQSPEHDSHTNESSDDSNGDTSSDTTNETDPTEGTGTTGATCPSTDAPTYENFGAAFMTAHCTRCHGSTVTGIARNGATPNYNFDTLEGVIEHAEEIESLAAAGPKATNTFMPPVENGPSVEERERLGEWMACLIEEAETAQ